MLVAIVATSILAACAGQAEWLNSERIQRTFGSYGVEILQDDGRRRVSSLYSHAGPDRITRTYAVVDFIGEPDEAFRREHEGILSGQSIGATFKESRWSISKQHLFIGELEIPADYVALGEHMHIDLPQALATHQYLFVIEKDDDSWNYATITEIHHPDYLSATDLKSIYGEIIFDDSNRDRIHDFIGLPPGK